LIYWAKDIGGFVAENYDELLEKLNDLDEKLSADDLRKLHKANLLKKVKAGEVGLVDEIEKLQRLEQREQSSQSDEQEEEPGIPKKLRIPRKYTLTPEALKQRQDAAKSPNKSTSMEGNNNAWKHGQYSKNRIAGFIRPCKSTCDHYPCSMIENGETKPGAPCLDKTNLLQTFVAIQKALTEKENENRFDDINEIVAFQVAGSLQIVEMLIEDIIRDNTICRSENYDGFGRIIGYDIKSHPSLFVLPKMIDKLGVTLNDLFITPKMIEKNKTEEKGLKKVSDIFSHMAGIKDPEEVDKGDDE
jgi:hypothetical protein